MVKYLKVIKEQKMTETLFEIASFDRPLYQDPTNSSNCYQSLLQNFCSTSYGLYTQYFIKKITTDAQSLHDHLAGFCLKKALRKCVKKFMLTDLQLIFLAHYCRINSWVIDSMHLLKEFKHEQNLEKCQIQQINLEMFLNLNAYFVKSYIGDYQQFHAIESYLTHTFPKFLQLYQKWVLSKPRQIFSISPRKINELYRQYSRSSQLQTNKKDYNDLVQTLIQLSTTYSIIPNKKPQRRQKIKSQSIQQNSSYNQRNNKNSSSQSNNRRQNKNNKNSQIFKIAEHEELEQSQIPRFGMDFTHNNRTRRKSSILFESLQSLSRKSEQLMAQNKNKQVQPVQEPPQQVQRSREKKPGNKVSLSFKKKQKPNQTVLGFIKQPSIMQQNVATDRGRADNRSILNQSLNMSFINLRSNRSSRSNSQLPFLWRPSEDNFFQKSKFG